MGFTMELTNGIPDEWKGKEGKTYETKYIYIGFRRLNSVTNKIQTIEVNPDGTWTFQEEDNLNSGVLSRSYNTELVTVTEYSQSPRVWSESIDPEHIFFFRQMS